jgi:transcriptional regulator with XRE-family HTH domain
VAEPDVNPTVARRELAVYFRRLREQQGMSLVELGSLLGVAQSQASRLDSGARGFGAEQVLRLCTWYGLADGERGRLLALAAEARRRAWWQQVALDESSESYRNLIGFEQVAGSILEFCSTVVPGLLQIEEYAFAVAEIGEIRPAESSQAVRVRMRRQEILRRRVPPELSVLIDEAVLARGAGGPVVMRKQLQYLLDATARPRTTVRVIGFEAGMYPAGVAQFILLGMPSHLQDIYYTEDQFRRSDSSDDADLGKARHLWSLLESIALNPVKSIERIERYRNEQKA